ncbi:peptidyl-tRNA hydrolase PTH2-domain-containing protein [Crassisporium funariophilum]|nr:peptidyl-tRNA hydrolase PTH2-domain-containing protein [Crassisporium funariophilum]
MGQNTVTVISVLVAASLTLGFWAGTKATRRTEFSPTVKPAVPSLPSKNSGTEDGDESGSDHSSNLADVDIAALRVSSSDECKMVLVVRTDLGMSSGKIAAQHATLACYKILLAKNQSMLRQWERSGQTKIALQCDDEEELLVLEAQAKSLNLCARSIQDAGRTQIAAGSTTVLGIAGPAKLVNQVTGRLRLLR